MGQSVSTDKKLHTAITNDNVNAFMDVYQSWVEKMEQIRKRDQKGRTLLQAAARNNSLKVATQMVRLGADVNDSSPRSGPLGSALHTAAALGHVEMVELLLAAGACPFTANMQGHSALDLAILCQERSVFRCLARKARLSGRVKVQGKVRWVVVVPWYSCPGFKLSQSTGRGADLSMQYELSPVPSQFRLLVFKDKDCVVPKAAFWLQGAMVSLTTQSVQLSSLHNDLVDLTPRRSGAPLDFTLHVEAVDSTPEAAAVVEDLLSLLDNMPSLARVSLQGAHGVQHVVPTTNPVAEDDMFELPQPPQLLQGHPQALPVQEDKCCICLEEPSVVGLRHGASVHKCVCRGCAAACVGRPCPLCRETVEGFLHVF